MSLLTGDVSHCVGACGDVLKLLSKSHRDPPAVDLACHDLVIPHGPTARNAVMSMMQHND